mmetsp:Transcript_95012/g.284830  ORF Transcript_95012/g.284830 Transcript_95012/m.284830 type:complete len:213 (-) Transcript_95012:418-1056(-)
MRLLLRATQQLLDCNLLLRDLVLEPGRRPAGRLLRLSRRHAQLRQLRLQLLPLLLLLMLLLRPLLNLFGVSTQGMSGLAAAHVEFGRSLRCCLRCHLRCPVRALALSALSASSLTRTCSELRAACARAVTACDCSSFASDSARTRADLSRSASRCASIAACFKDEANASAASRSSVAREIVVCSRVSSMSRVRGTGSKGTIVPSGRVLGAPP